MVDGEYPFPFTIFILKDMARFFRFLIGLLLLPLCFAATWATLDVIKKIPSARGILSPELMWIVIGFCSWLIIWFALRRPSSVYVFGHEMTHAIWGMLFGAHVSKMKVSSVGGSVLVSKDNILITLAPYFFPFYTMLVLLLRWICGFFIQPVPWPMLWLFLVGFTWSFHICFTVHSLLIAQPDCQQYGYLLSYSVIFLFNLEGVGLWIVCATDVPLRYYATVLLSRSEYVYYMLYLFSARSCRRLFQIL